MPPKVSASKPLLPTDKIPLPEYLKKMNQVGMSMAHAMGIAGKIYKTYNTPEKLGGLTVDSLVKLGVEDKDRRREIMQAFQEYKTVPVESPRTPSSSSKAGNTSASRGMTHSEDQDEANEQNRKIKEDKWQARALDVDAKRRAALETFQEGLEGKSKDSPSKKRKRGRDDDLLFDPTEAVNSSRVDDIRNLQFNEVLDEEVLKSKTVIINRAPVMMAWSCVVAEALGFGREEALSIASAYTEMNATTKGTNLGIYDKEKGKGMEPGPGTAQPHVELMGRRIPLFQTENSQWRALLKGEPVSPSKPHAYITRSLAQMCPYLIGALILLARSFDDPQKLNYKAFSLYCDFRPGGGGWGAKGEVKLDYILRLRDRQRDGPDSSPGKKEEGEEKKPIPAQSNVQTSTELPTTKDEMDVKDEEDFTLEDLYDDDDV